MSAISGQRWTHLPPVIGPTKPVRCHLSQYVLGPTPEVSEAFYPIKCDIVFSKTKLREYDAESENAKAAM